MAQKFTDQNGLLYIFTKIKQNFVQKVAGKDLSTNDFTDDLKNKLDGISAGAEVNVQSDWNATSGDAAILNKPTKVSQFTNDAGFITTSDIPEGAAASTTTPKMDGTAAVGSELAFARGDHVHPSDTSRVPTTRKVNGKALSSDVTLSASDVGAVPTTRKVNGKALSADITLAAADVSAVPTTRTVNGKALSSNVTLSADDVSAIPTSAKGAANGVASLDADGKVPSAQLPSYVDDVIEGYYYNDKFYSDSSHSTAITGESSKIYVDLTTNLSYRYSGTVFVLITSADMVALTNEGIEAIYNNA